MKATIDDTSRFCANDDIFSVVSIDTTFNIAEYLSIVHKDSSKHPWFPGPLLAHQDKGKLDYSFLWQASKRGNGSLKRLKGIGTDEDSALIEGILKETDGQTIHLLRKEHVQQNVAKKLAEYNFLERQKRRTSKDIFGNEQQTDCLYECESFEEFARRVEECKDMWAVLERVYTRNDPPTKFSTYFEKYKQNSIRST